MTKAKKVTFRVRNGTGDMGRCRACNKPVLFWTHPLTGNTLPLDPATAEYDEDDAEAQLLESHFARCTEPQRFRRST